jgi:cis-L-3-hydroxyproline dehydratase
VRIRCVEVYAYVVRYAHGEYVMSGGRATPTQDGTLVRLRTDEGLDGWGEVTTLGATYLPAFAGSVRAALGHLAPVLIGLDPTNLARVNAVLDSTLQGHQFAKSAVDIACWDLFGRAVERPVVDLLGGRLHADFPLYEAVPLGTPESMVDYVERRLDAGIRRFQLKVGNEPADDIARVRATRSALPDDDTVLIADANTGWSLLSGRRAIRGLADLDVYVEQPCRSTAECRLAMAGSALPLILDESVLALQDLPEVLTAGAVAVNLKISRLGGLTKAVRLRDAAQDLGLSMCIEDTWGGDITTAAVSHLAAGTRPDSLLHASFFNDWTDGHVAGHEPRSVGGRGAAPEGPGLGIDVDESRVGDLLFSEEAG